jgi:RNA polymerase sigma factor (sigma-70 family)
MVNQLEQVVFHGRRNVMGKDAAAARQFQTLFRHGNAGGRTDRVLLERFLDGDREAAEAAFEVLVARHGPMVLRACRQVLTGTTHDADDAFQATFLLLARRARSIRARDSLASWLHAVAVRVANDALRSANVRRKHEHRSATLTPRGAGDDRFEPDACAVLHEELTRLPAPFRAAVVLCHLEGLTHDQAAEQLGWPVGTVRSRLARARQRLKQRLIRRGLAPAALLAATAAADAAPLTLRRATVEAALRAAMQSTAVAALAERATHASLLTRAPMLVGRMLVLGVVSTGLLTACRYTAVTSVVPPVAAVSTPPAETAPAETPPEPPHRSEYLPTKRVTDGDTPVKIGGIWNWPFLPPTDPNLAFPVFDLKDFKAHNDIHIYTSARMAELPGDAPSDEIVATLGKGDIYCPENGVIAPLHGTRIGALDLPPIPHDADVVVRTMALQTGAATLTMRQVAEQVLANPRCRERLRLEDDGRYAILRPDGQIILLGAHKAGDDFFGTFIPIGRVTLEDVPSVWPKTIKLAPGDIDADIAAALVPTLNGKARIDAAKGEIFIRVPFDDAETPILQSCAKTPEARKQIKDTLAVIREAEKAFGGTGQTRMPTPTSKE